MKFFKVVIVLFLLVNVNAAQAQDQLQNVAIEYLRNNDFAKAAELFAKLYDNNPADALNQEYYIKSLMGLKEYKNAEKIIKGLLKKNKKDINLNLLLADIYNATDNVKKAEKLYDNIVTDNCGNDNEVRQAAAILENNKLPDYSIMLYELARKRSDLPLLYAEELAALYDKKGDFEKATESLLDLISKNPTKIENVKTTLLKLFNQKSKIDIVRKKIIKRINEQTDNINYPDILAWLYIQQKNYESAFIQVKAIDIRLHENGMRPLNFARIATKEKEYNAALQAYDYILDLGADKQLYLIANSEKLNTLKIQLENNTTYTKADVDTILLAYEKYFEANPNALANDTRVEYAMLQARFGNNISKAIAVLTAYIDTRGISMASVGRAKLDLGDYQLINNNNWEASLLYSQVDKAFKNDALGEDARYRNARLSYYTGDYVWAQSQLDILKASTSELIANDALNLSVLITENLIPDTNLVPIQTFSRAELLIFQNKIEAASKALDSITNAYPSHPLIDNILMVRADIETKKHNYKKAFSYYKNVFTNHADDILADDAIYKAALIQEKYLNAPEEAKKLFEKIILDFPGSSFVTESRKAYRRLRGDVLEE